jgi:hypothetical protein
VTQTLRKGHEVSKGGGVENEFHQDIFLLTSPHRILAPKATFINEICSDIEPSMLELPKYEYLQEFLALAL